MGEDIAFDWLSSYYQNNFLSSLVRLIAQKMFSSALLFDFIVHKCNGKKIRAEKLKELELIEVDNNFHLANKALIEGSCEWFNQPPTALIDTLNLRIAFED